MRAADKAKSVAIFTRGWSGLYYDDRGVTVDGPLWTRQFAWSDISHFADGCWVGQASSGWVLNIVLRSGRRVRVPCTEDSPTPELLAAVRRVADWYAVPARLTGIMMKNGRPVDRGFYQDPGGQAGLRYWDGKRWSPLLRHQAGRGWPRGSQSAALWAELPVTPVPWTYPTARTARALTWTRVWAVVTAGLLAMGVETALANRDWNYFGAFWMVAVVPAACLIPMWLTWRRWKAIKKAASDLTTIEGARS